jgi:hypothetical protein
MHRPRASSIPRRYRQHLPAQEKFTVTDATLLKLRLQALDDGIAPDVAIDALKAKCQVRPFHEEVYVDGSEEFFLLVKAIPRADLIPDVYMEAYHALQCGRFPINQHRVSDFTKGVDPTWSDVNALLDRIDDLCGTKLDDAFRRLSRQGKRCCIAHAAPANTVQSSPSPSCSCRLNCA